MSCSRNWTSWESPHLCNRFVRWPWILIWTPISRRLSMEGTGNKAGHRIVVLVARALVKTDFSIWRTWQPRHKRLQIERAERIFHEIYVLGKRFRCHARRRQGQRRQRQQVRRLETHCEWLLLIRGRSRLGAIEIERCCPHTCGFYQRPLFRIEHACGIALS